MIALGRCGCVPAFDRRQAPVRPFDSVVATGRRPSLRSLAAAVMLLAWGGAVADAWAQQPALPGMAAPVMADGAVPEDGVSGDGVPGDRGSRDRRSGNGGRQDDGGREDGPRGGPEGGAGNSPIRLADLRLHPADPARDHLEPGGAWAGRSLSEIGDTVTFTLRATEAGSGLPLDRLDLELMAPAGVRLGAPITVAPATVAPATVAPGTGCGNLDVPSVELRSGMIDGSVGLVMPDSRRLPPGCGLTVTLRAIAPPGTAAVVGSLEVILHDRDSDDLLDQVAIPLTVRAPAPVLEVSRLTPYVIPGDPVIWALRVANIGDGGMLGGSVGIDRLGSAFTLRSTTTVAAPLPVAPSINNETGRVTIPYLPPGATAEFRIEAVSAEIGAIAGTCGDPDARFALSHIGGGDPVSVDAAIELMTDEPDLRIVAPAPGLHAGQGRFAIRNVGLGVARSIAVDAFWPTGAVVTLESPDWHYQEHASGGRFVFTGGTIQPAEIRESAFRVTWPEGRRDQAARLTAPVLWRTAYRNACGAIRHGPGLRAPLIAAAADADSRLSLTIEPLPRAPAPSGDRDRELTVAAPADYRLVLRAADPSALPGDRIEVRETIPDFDEAAPSGPFGTVRRVRIAQQPALPGAEVSCSGRCQGGDTVTWRVPTAAIDGPVAINVSLETQPNACLAGLSYRQAATARLHRRDGSTVADLMATARLDRRMENGNAGADTLAQSFTVAPRTDGKLAVEASYRFPGSMISVWDTTRYIDDFGAAELFPDGIGAVVPAMLPALIPESLTVSVNGGEPVPVPAAAVSDGNEGICDPAVSGSCRGGLGVDFGFLTDDQFVGTERVAGTDGNGTTITLRYGLRPGIGVHDGGDVPVYQQALLDLADPAADGGCHSVEPGSTRFVQGAYANLVQRPAAVALRLPGTIGMCRPFPVTVNMALKAPMASLRLDFADQDAFRFDPAAPAGQGEGVLAGLAPDAEAEEGVAGLTVFGRDIAVGAGSYTAMARMIPGDVAPAKMLMVDARVTDPVASPHTVRLPAPVPTVVSPIPTVAIGPSTLTIGGSIAARWTVAVGNVGAGLAGPVAVSVSIPEGLTVTDGDRAAMDAEHADLFGDTGSEVEWMPSPDGGGRLTWRLPGLDPGALLAIQVQASLEPGRSPDRDVVARVSVALDCGVAGPVQMAEVAGPLFVFPRGALSIAHDLDDSECTLCEGGVVTLGLRNAGRATLSDLIVEEDLGSARTGLFFEPDSVAISTDGGVSFAPLGPSANPSWRGGILRWTRAEIPSLSELAPAPVSSGAAQLLIKFGITAGSEAYSPGDYPSHSLIARAAGTQPFGTVTDAPPHRVRLPIAQPKLMITKLGRNLTQDSDAGAEVYGGAGDVIEWRIGVRNTGQATARHVRIEDGLSGSLGSVRLVGYEGPDSAALALPLDLTGDPLLLRSLPALAPGESAMLVIEEVLGKRCVGPEDRTLSDSTLVGFACSAIGEAGTTVIDGVVEDAAATLTTLPKLSALRHGFAALPNGRGRITLSVDNAGGTATALVLTDNLPDGFELDTTVPIDVSVRGTVAYGAGPGISGASLSASTTEPVISFDRARPGDGRGILRHGETLTASFEIIPMTGFDRESDPFRQPETAAAGDPIRTVGTVKNRVGLAFESTCGGDADAVGVVTEIDPLTPDIDFAPPQLASPMLAPDELTEIVLPLVNNGEPGSIADSVTVTITTGGGLALRAVDVVDADDTGAPPACAILTADEAVCTPHKLGPLVAGPGDDGAADPDALPARVIRLLVAALDNGRPLALRARAEADLPTGGGEDIGLDISLDRVRVALVGLVADKRLTAPAAAVAHRGPDLPTVLVGDMIAWDYDLRWFGLDHGETLTDIRVVDRFPVGRLDYAGLRRRPADPARVDAEPGPGGSGVLALTRPRMAAPGGALSARVAARAVGRTDSGFPDGFGLSFALDLVEDQARHRVTLGLGRPDPSAAPKIVTELRQPLGFQVRAPDLSATLGVANTDRVCAVDRPFADSVVGDAGDRLTFALTVRNAPDAVAAFDVTALMTLPDGMELLPFDEDGLDNDPAAAAAGYVAAVDVAAGQVRFGGRLADGRAVAAPPLKPDGLAAAASLARLDPGGAVRLYFCARTGAGVALGEVIRARATVSASTGAASTGALSGTIVGNRGQAVRNRADPVTVETLADAALSIAVTSPTVKQIVAAEANPAGVLLPATRTDALVGERLRLRLTTVLPAGIANDLAIVETLDPGLVLLPGSSQLTVGAGLSGCGTAARLEPDRKTMPDGRARLVWPVGTCRAGSDGDEAQRQLSLSYLLMVDDLPAVRQGALLSAQAAIRVGETGSDRRREIPVEQTLIAVREPAITVTVTALSAATGGSVAALNAGEVVDVAIRLSNQIDGPAVAASQADGAPATGAAAPAVKASGMGASGVELGGAGVPDVAAIPTRAAGDEPGPAEDVRLSLELPDGLRYVADSSRGEGFAEPVQEGDRIVWGQGGALFVPVNGDRVLTLRLQVADTIRSGSALTVPYRLRWASIGRRLAAPSGFDRTAADALVARRGADSADYRASGRIDLAVRDATTLAKTVAPPPAGSEGRYRIGELVTFTLDLELQEGSHDGLSLEDRLPAGMEFYDTVAIDPANGQAGFDYAMAFARRKTSASGAELPVPAQPVAGDRGRLEWRFATLRNLGDGDPANDRLKIRYRARIVDDVARLPSQSRLLSKPMRLSGTAAIVRYESADGPVSRATDPAGALEIGQPAVRMVATRLSEPAFGENGFAAGKPVAFSLEITNHGTAAAHRVRVVVDLQSGITAAGPEQRPVSMLLLDGRGLPLERDRDFEARFDPDRGLFSISLTDTAAAYIAPGETLGINFQVVLDPQLGAGRTAAAAIRLDGYRSVSDPDAARKYPGGEATRFTFVTPTPQSITQEVLVGGRPDANNRAAIGQEVTFLLTVPAVPVGASLYDVRVEDSVPLGMKVIRVESNAEHLSNAGTIDVTGLFALDAPPLTAPVRPYVREDGVRVFPPLPKPLASRPMRPARRGDNDVGVVFSRIPPGAQGQVRVIAVPENLIANTTASTFRNRARYRWASSPGAAPSDWVGTGEPAVVRVAEPDVAVNKTGRPPGGLDAGDTVTYTIRVDNIGAVLGAYDFTLTDRLPKEVRFIPGSVTLFAGRPLADPIVVTDADGHQVLTWRADNAGDIDLAPGESIEFSYQAKLTDDVRPGRALRGALHIAWTSTDGPNPYERDGSGTPRWNNYFIVDPGDVLIADGGRITKTVTDGPLDGGAYRIGDRVPIGLRVALSEGTYEDLVIEDELPPGFVFERADPIRAVSGGGAAPSAGLPDQVEMPRNGATGVVQWKIGRLVIPGDNERDDALVLRYTARVADDAQALRLPGVQSVTEARTAPTLRFAGAITDEPIDRVGEAIAVTVAQPDLVLEKAIDRAVTPPRRAPGEYASGDRVRYRLTVRNNGSGPAHDVEIRDRLPEAMRSHRPILIPDAIRLAGAPVSPAFDGSRALDSGDLIWRLAGDTAIGPGEALVLVYEAQIAPDVGGGVAIGTAAGIDGYASVPGGRRVGGRVYGAVTAAAVMITTPMPSGATMSVMAGEKPGRRRANVGDPVRYTLTVPSAPLEAVLYDVLVENELPAGLAITAGDVSGRLTAGPSEPPGVSVTGRSVKIRFAAIPAGSQAVITLNATVANAPTVGAVARAGSVSEIVNRTARYRWARRPLADGGSLMPVGPVASGPRGEPPAVPDGATAPGPDGATAPGIYASADAVTVTEPRLAVESAVIADPSPAQSGDHVAYRVRIRNQGDGRAFDVGVIAALPEGLAVQSARLIGIDDSDPDDPGAPDAVASLPQPDAIGRRDDGHRLVRWPLGDLAINAGLRLELTLAVTESAQLLERLGADALVEWSSISGAVAGKRTGVGTPPQNDYQRRLALPAIGIAGPALSLAAGGDPGPGGLAATAGRRHAVGETTIVTATIRPPRATGRGIRLHHKLDPGLQFDGVALQVQDVTRPDGQMLDGPVSATLVSDGVVLELGDLQAVGPSPYVSVSVRARLRDSKRVRDGAVMTHRATLSFTAPDRLADQALTAAERDGDRLIVEADGAPPDITVVEPGPLLLEQKVLAAVTPPRAGRNLFFAGDTVRLELALTNRGDGPAYDVALETRLPAGMRRAAPVLVQAVLDETGASVALTADGSRLADDGVIAWKAAPGALPIPSGGTMLITVDLKLDADVGAGRRLPILAQLAGFMSGPALGADGRPRIDVRQYAPGPPQIITLRVPEPQDIMMIQLAGEAALDGGLPSDAPQTANIGEPVLYTLTVPATPVIATLYDVAIIDRVPDGIRVDQVSVDAATLGDPNILVTGTGPRGARADPDRVRVEIERIPAGRQAIVRIVGIVQNHSDTTRGRRFENSASFTWASAPGAQPAAPLVTPAPLALTVAEPRLTLIAGFDPPPDRPVQAGDRLIYRFALGNDGDGIAHEPQIVFSLDNSFDLAATRPAPDDPGRPTVGGEENGRRRLIWQLPRSLAPGETRRFDVVLTVGARAQMFERMAAETRLRWRTATGTEAESFAIDAPMATVPMAGLRFRLEEAAEGQGLYDIGETITYDAVMSMVQGQASEVRIDVEPDPGLSFVTAAVEVGDLVRIDGGSDRPVELIDLPPAETAEPGELSFALGDLMTVGPTPELRLKLTMRVRDVPANRDGAALSTKARVTLINPNAMAADRSDGLYAIPAEAGPVLIALLEPALTMVALERLSASTVPPAGGRDRRPLFKAGDAVRYRLIASNDGNAPAHNAVLQFDLPPGMQDAPPLLIGVALDGAEVPVDRLEEGTAAEGALVWRFPDDLPVPPGKAVALTLDSRINPEVGGALALAPAGRVVSFHSQPAGRPNERRAHGGGEPAADNIATPAPGGLRVVRRVNGLAGAAGANIGDILAYTLLVPAEPVLVALYNVEITDRMPEGVRIDAVEALLGAAGNPTRVQPSKAVRSNGRTVRVALDRIPAGEQAQVTIRGMIGNAAAARAGVELRDQPRYSWAQAPGGPRSPPVGPVRDTDPVLVREPRLAVTIDRLPPTVPIDAGDRVSLRIGVRNGGDGPAHGVLLRVLTDPLMMFADIGNVAAAAGEGAVAPGLPDNGGLAGREQDWQWQLGRLGVDEETAFDVTFRIGDGVEPRQRLLARVQSLWRSTPEVADETRDGSGSAPQNDYASITRPLAIDAGLGHKVAIVARGDTLTGPAPAASGEGAATATGGYRIGDFAEYALTVRLPEGRIRDVVLRDALPAGMAYEDHVAIAAGNARMQFEQPTGDAAPTPGQEGEVVWRIGTVVNPGDNNPDNDTLTLVYRIRIRDSEGVIPVDVPHVDMVNAAQLAYADAAGDRVESVRVSAAVTVRQPVLRVALDGPTSGTLELTETGGFVVRAVNAGAAPAYGPEVLVRLPDAMRALDPRSVGLRVAIDRGGVRDLEPETEYSVDYDATPSSPRHGLLTVRLAGDSLLAPGETLGVSFQAGFDPGTPDGTTVQMVAGLGVYSSRNPNKPPVRTVTRNLDDAGGGVPNADAPIGWSDDTVLTVRAPDLSVIKAVADLNGGDAMPGDRLRYTVIVENAGSVPARRLVLRDVLDHLFEPGSLGGVAVAPATGRASGDDTGGPDGTGAVLVEDMTVPAARQSAAGQEPGRVTISYEADIRNVLADRTRISTQARLTAPGYPAELLSDARDPDASDQAEGGNDPGDPTDDDPTEIIVRARPAMVLSALVTVPGGDDAVLEPGGTVTVTLNATNQGTEALVNARLAMPMPALARYVPGSLTVNGLTIDDPPDGAVPFSGDGLAVGSPGSPPGRIDVGKPPTVRFDLQADALAPVGARLVGQAWLTGAGEGSGRIPPVRSDDPTTAPPGDPWSRVIGGGPVLVATLGLRDMTGPPLLPGDDRLAAKLIVANGGDRPARNVTAVLPLPPMLRAVPDTLLLDTDGGGEAPPVRQGRVTQAGLSLPVGDLEPGRSVVFTVQLAVGPDAPDRMDIQGEVVATNHPEVATLPAGGSLRVAAPTAVSLRGVPALTAVQTVEAEDAGPVEPGAVLIYTLELRNAAAAAGPAFDIVLLDQVPLLRQTERRLPLAYIAGSTEVDGRPIPGAASPLAAGLRLAEVAPGAGRLAPGGRRLLRYRYRVPQNEAFLPGSMLLAQALVASNSGAVRVAADSGRDDGVEAGNLAGFPNDDDPTAAFIGGVVGLGPGHGRTGGVLFMEDDNDGRPSATESRLAGWQVDLQRDGDTLASTVTGRYGSFGFGGLPAGDGYIMVIRHPETGTTFGAVGPYGERERAGRLLPGDHAVLGGIALVSGGAVYDSVTRAPVPGAKVTLLFNDLPVPDTSLMPGQQDQVTGTDGLYRFILRDRLPRSNAANLYRIHVEPPHGFAATFPSGLLPPRPLPHDGAPGPQPGIGYRRLGSGLFPSRGDQPQPYHLTFIFNEGDQPVLNNHIPVDPLAGAQVELAKTVVPSIVAPGDTIEVSLTAGNLTGAPVRRALREVLPTGFAYLPGTARVDGRSVEPTVSGRSLTWDGLPFPTDRTLAVSFRVRPVMSTRDGSYESRSFVLDKASNLRMSNIATTALRVAIGQVAMCRDVSGTVFEDRDGNGRPDGNEAGLPAVRIQGPGGTMAVTDPTGRFAFDCPDLAERAVGGAVQLLLDESSLPSGFSAMGRNPRRIVLEGVLNGTVDFPVTQQRVVRLDLADGAFEPRAIELKRRWVDSLDQLMTILREGPSMLRLTYRVEAESDALVEQRIAAVARTVRRLWAEDHGGYALRIDPQLVRGWTARRSGASRQ